MNVTLEIRAAIADFMTHFAVSVGSDELAAFFRHLEKKKSLVNLDLDCISAIEELLHPYDMLVLARTCKYTYGRVGLTRSRICNAWYPENTLSGVTPRDKWIYMCADWYEIKLFESAMCGTQHRDIVKSEKSIKYCQYELDDLIAKRTKNSLEATNTAIEMYQEQIAAEKKHLAHLRHSGCQSRSCVEFDFMLSCVKWMIPSDALMDIPKSDTRLRKGMTRSEYIAHREKLEKEAKENEDYDYVSDDEVYGCY